jgi:putative membrane protein
MQKLSPRSIWLFTIGNIFKSVFAIIFVALITVPAGLPFLLAKKLFPTTDILTTLWQVLLYAVIGIIILSYIWAWLTYRSYKYELADSFKKESGVIAKRYVSIPYERIQNVDIYRGLFDRMLGLSRLFIQTAGSSTQRVSEASLPGLSVVDAEILRQQLTHKAVRN